MYNLTEEQIVEIQNDYCDSRQIIIDIAEELNRLNVAQTEEDFIEIVSSTAWQYSAFKMKVLNDIEKKNVKNPVVLNILNNFDDYLEEYAPISSVLQSEIQRKYGEKESIDMGFEDEEDSKSL